MPSDDDETARDAPNRGAADPPRAAPGAWDRAEHQRLWLRLRDLAWRTLAVVPAEGGMPTHDVASALAAVGVRSGASIGALDGRDLRLTDLVDGIDAAPPRRLHQDRFVIATRSIEENLATIELARAVDGVVLCVSLGATAVRSIAETIDQIGRDRFLGSVLLRARRSEVPARSPISLRRRAEA